MFDTTKIENIEQKPYVIEVKHMKSGSSLVLCISKLRVAGDTLEEVKRNYDLAMEEFAELMNNV
tara:strand:+ start:16611 stop:16802 length:192 start_codon:yes stop_codon:yes gene_type:complete